MPRRHRGELLNSLALRAKDGDKEAYGKLFRECYKEIYAYVFWFSGNTWVAEDITMQVFANGLAAIKNYDEKGFSVKAWFYRIAHNLVIDHFRKTKTTVDIDELPIVNTVDAEVEEIVTSRHEH